MDSQAMIVNKKLANAVLAGGLFAIASVFAGTVWILFSHKQVLDMKAEYAMFRDSVQNVRGVTRSTVTPPVQESVIALSDTLAKEETTKPEVKTDTAVVAGKAAITQAKTEKPKAAVTNRLVRPQDILLIYYYRKADNESLQAALSTLSYNIEVKTLDKNTGYQKTNCIWFGAGVPLKEVKKVAVALIQAGNTIKGIKRFPMSKKDASYKRNIIEVGMDDHYENFYTRPLSIFEVEKAKDFR